MVSKKTRMWSSSSCFSAVLVASVDASCFLCDFMTLDSNRSCRIITLFAELIRRACLDCQCTANKVPITKNQVPSAVQVAASTIDSSLHWLIYIYPSHSIHFPGLSIDKKVSPPVTSQIHFAFLFSYSWILIINNPFVKSSDLISLEPGAPYRRSRSLSVFRQRLSVIPNSIQPDCGIVSLINFFASPVVFRTSV